MPAEAARSPRRESRSVVAKLVSWSDMANPSYELRDLLVQNSQPQVLEADLHGEALMELQRQNALLQGHGTVIDEIGHDVAIDAVDDVTASDHEVHVVPVATP